ncbi:MAG: phosphomannose isomerase type II C-terminal cupin domain [Chloroflexi bacterium]|nr:phosphomannose isomerase type II C-terminal cupin domain [Chloroflexota bacterium]
MEDNIVEKPEISRVERPWGRFSQYAFNQPVTVSLMTVQPNQRLSLQAHANRSELWIVLDDSAVVQVGEQVLYPKQGDEIWIPAKTAHRLGGQDRPVRVLEVAYGNWRQDDITRYEDDYQRPAQGE